jgi:ribosomal protein S18 acetylase RimI-like enzyme
MKIEQIHNQDGINIEAINALIAQQSPGDTRLINIDDIKEALSNPNFYLFVAVKDLPQGQKIVGMATIFFQRNIARYISEIHDVVVDENCRGQGLGEQLVRTLIAAAHTFASERNTKIKLFLTSRPSRVAANKLYLKLGFTLVAEATGSWGTNLYKLMVIP